MATLFALVGAVVLSTPNAANAQTTQTRPTITPTRGAPGPIAGAGLSVLAVGFGVYWLIKRRRRKTE